MKQMKQGFFFRNNRRQLSKGQGLVEFALVIPIFLLLLFGIFEFGRYLTAIITINTASREGARYGAGIGNSNAGVPYYRDCAGITNAATQFGMFAGIHTVEIHYDNGPDSYTDWDTLPTCSNTIKVGLADRIGVRVTGEYTPVILFTEATIPLESISFRTLVTKLDIRSTEYPIATQTTEPTATWGAPTATEAVPTATEIGATEEPTAEPTVEPTPITDPCTAITVSNITGSGGLYQFEVANDNVIRAEFEEIYITFAQSNKTDYFQSLMIEDISATPIVRMFLKNDYAYSKTVVNFTWLPKTAFIDYPEGSGIPIGVEADQTVKITFGFSKNNMTWNSMRIQFLLNDYYTCTYTKTK